MCIFTTRSSLSSQGWSYVSKLLGETPILQVMTDESASNIASHVKNNLQEIRSRISAAAVEAGRDPDSVRLLPVSKTFGEDSIRAAYDAGIRLLGENKVQEAVEKHDSMQAELPDLEWAVIGHLQRNKAKFVARMAQEFHALDSERVASTLERRLELEDRTLDVFVQVNTSGEESKFGLEPDKVTEFVKSLAPYERLNVRGLMTLALFSSDLDKVRPCFVKLRGLRDEIQQFAPEAKELSMGMSGDFELAIAEGATTVRVGTAIFGDRPSDRDEAHYWPGAAR